MKNDKLKTVRCEGDRGCKRRFRVDKSFPVSNYVICSRCASDKRHRKDMKELMAMFKYRIGDIVVFSNYTTKESGKDVYISNYNNAFQMEVLAGQMEGYHKTYTVKDRHHSTVCIVDESDIICKV